MRFTNQLKICWPPHNGVVEQCGLQSGGRGFSSAVQGTHGGGTLEEGNHTEI
jgi:hypothetical protein